MAEHSPCARHNREKGDVPLASPAAYDRRFDTGWGRYPFTVEQAAIERAAGRLDGLRVLDAGCGTGRFTAAFVRCGAWLAADARELPFPAAGCSRLPPRPGSLYVVNCEDLECGGPQSERGELPRRPRRRPACGAARWTERS